MKRLTIKGFDFTSDFVASHLQSWPIAEALKKLQQIEDAMEERELHPTTFDRITASPATMGAFLASLPVLDGPWDDAFHRAYCDDCPAENCDAPGGCPRQEIRENVIPWWLAKEAGPGECGL